MPFIMEAQTACAGQAIRGGYGSCVAIELGFVNKTHGEIFKRQPSLALLVIQILHFHHCQSSDQNKRFRHCSQANLVKLGKTEILQLAILANLAKFD